MKLTTWMTAAYIAMFPLCLTQISAEDAFDAQTRLDTLREEAKSGKPFGQDYEVARFAQTLRVDTLREGAKLGDPFAQDELARRLFAGEAHTPQVRRILQDAQSEFDELESQLKELESQLKVQLDPYMPLHPKMRELIEEKQRKLEQLKQKQKQKLEELNKLKSLIEEKEAKEALELLESAASKKHINSMLLLAWIYSECKHVPNGLERSVELNRQAAELGDPAAMCNLGNYYAKGKGVVKNVQESVMWYEKAYAKGYYKAGSLLADILTDGGLYEKDDGYPKNPQRAYVLGRSLQLADRSDGKNFHWGGLNVQRARKHLEAEQLLAAETEAEKEAERLQEVARVEAASSVKADAGKPSINLKTPGAITKEQWKAALGRVHPAFGQAGVILMSKKDFIQICGEPQKTQTVGDTVYWYYKCSDGLIQLCFDKGNLLVGTVAGKANDY